MTSAHVRNRALKHEYERRGKEATEQQFSATGPDEKLMYSERARVYFEIAASLSDMDERRVDEMRGRNVGMKEITIERLEFLRAVSKNIGKRDPGIVADIAVSNHTPAVRRLWKTSGRKAHTKILNFIKNHPL